MNGITIKTYGYTEVVRIDVRFLVEGDLLACRTTDQDQPFFGRKVIDVQVGGTEEAHTFTVRCPLDGAESTYNQPNWLPVMVIRTDG